MMNRLEEYVRDGYVVKMFEPVLEDGVVMYHILLEREE